MRSKFIRGVATGATNPGATGGSTTHTHTVVARDHNHGTSNSAGSHFHTFNAYTWTHSHNLSAGTSVDNYKQSDTGGGNHTHSNTDTIGNTTHTVGTGGSHTHTNDATASLSLPAYYTVAWIISTGATTVPTNGILIWTGLLVNIPANYNLCDGASGRPELRGKFLYGAVAGNDPGGTGGSDTHLHTEAGDSAAHTDHAVALDAGHTHTVSATTGAHTHSQVQEGGWGTTAKWSINASGGDHTHTFTATTHNDHTVSSVAGHNHEPWVNADTRPAYYEVAFISAPESNAAPTVSSVSLNADTSFSPVESTIKSANVTGQVIDSDGCSDVTYITALAYRSGVSSTCSANDNNCYRGITCSTSCSGTTVSCTCAASIWFHADPTDAGTYVAQYWQGAILATDSASNTVLGASTNTTVDLNTLLALDVTTSIAYGSLSPGADTGATNQNVTVTATGNAAIDCSVKGTDMTGGVGGTILASKQKYDLAAFTYSTGGTAFTAKNTDAALELVCAKPSTHPSDSTDIIYWGLGVDNGTPAAADYSGTNTFTVTPE